MNCPKCNVTLLMSSKEWVEIDYCPQCRWVWLDRWELETLIQRESKYYSNNQPQQQYSDSTNNKYSNNQPQQYTQPSNNNYKDDDNHQNHWNQNYWNQNHQQKSWKKENFLMDMFDF